MSRVFWVILCMASAVMVVSGADQFSSEMYLWANDGYIGVSDISDTLTARSKIACCYMCFRTEGCNSGSFRSKTGACHLSTKRFFDTGEVSFVHDLEWSVCSTKHSNNWFIVFRGCAGLGPGHSIKQAFVEGSDVTSTDIQSSWVFKTCTHHYRNPLLDIWDSLGVKKMKMTIYNETTWVNWMHFDATDKPIDGWFHQDTLSASYRDAVGMTAATFDSFQMEGPFRDFEMNVVGGGSFFQAIYQERTDQQPQDVQTSYPQFLYATTDTFGYPETMADMAMAKSIALYAQNPK